MNPYENLLSQIAQTYEKSRARVFLAANQELLESYWKIGQYIVEFEQKGQEKAQYGTELLKKLAQDLQFLGKGFSRSNLANMRLFYLRYPIIQTASGQLQTSILATVSHKLTWSHYVELVKVEHDLERSFYEKQCLNENWSVRELKRQKDTALFLRLASGKNPEQVLALAQKGQEIQKPEDILKEPYIFEFLKVPEPYHISEKALEKGLIDHLQAFLLELGKGFAFLGRQYRITVNNEHFYVDLVFYHHILKCFVLIDLKINEVKHQDIGQMNMYLGYFAKERNMEGDREPIGIILSRQKDEFLVEYATYGMQSQLWVAQYQLYLPTETELKTLLQKLDL